jgi:steroid delta-isomerase-like uncharacterized protein
MATDNIAVVRRYLEEVWNKGNFAVFNELISEKYVAMEPVIGEVRGMEALRQYVQTFRTAFPDLRVMIEDIGVVGDRVFCRWTGRGTHRGAFMGIPPTNNKGDVRGISIDRLQNGKIVEHHESYDSLMMFQIMGVVPQLDLLIKGQGQMGAEQQRRL